MQVRPRRAAGRAYFANNVASFHHIALLAVELIHMAVHSDQALPVIDKNTISVEKKLPVKIISPSAGAMILAPRGAAISRPLCGRRACSLKNRFSPNGLDVGP